MSDPRENVKANNNNLTAQKENAGTMPTATQTHKPRIRKSPGTTGGAGGTQTKDGRQIVHTPDKSFLDSYIQRELVPGLTEFDAFDLALENGHNVLIEGPTGPGKTSAVLAYAAKKGAYFYSIPSNVSIDPSHLFGKMRPTDVRGVFRWGRGGVTELVELSQIEGNICVLLINEVNFMPDKIATVLMPLTDKRREITLLDNDGEVVRAGRGPAYGEGQLLVVADMNPDYEGTRPLNKAFRNRFAMQWVWDYDEKVEAKLVKALSLRNMAAKFRKDHATGLYETPVSTNMLQEFELNFAQKGWAWARFNFVNHFPSHERDAAVKVLDTFEANIKGDLEPKPKPTEGAGGRKTEVTSDEYQPDLSRDWKTGDVDPVLGIYGIDWELEDES